MSVKFSAQLSGINGRSLGEILTRELISGENKALGIISAFVTIGGFRDILTITRRSKDLECRMLAGISNAVTHPQALTEALTAGWRLRLGSAARKRLFHPKIIVSGRSFLPNGGIDKPSFIYIGSSNLTKGGLRHNVECGIVAHAEFEPPSVMPSFIELWNSGAQATMSEVDAYAEEFAERNRQRSTDDLEALGVADTSEDETSVLNPLKIKRSMTTNHAMPESVALAAWAGLESFTGGYRFQVEFPQAAGLVLGRIIGSASRSEIAVLCTGDNTVRNMSYRFYSDNGMFRLNIPNETPGVQLARRTHEGIALVEVSSRQGVRIQLTLVPPGDSLNEIVKRSYILGTWGNTSTRRYGWY